ncbi:Multidrug resistance-associated protein 1, partial [Entophlyctis luteolus]
MRTKLGMYPLFKQGFKTTLTFEDLYPLAHRYSVVDLVDQFEELWRIRFEAYKEQLQVAKTSGKKDHKVPVEPSCIAILVEMFGRGFFPIGILKFVADMCNCAAPLVLQVIINYISDSGGPNPPPLYLGFLYALGLFIMNMVASTCVQFFFSRAVAYGMTIRATLTGTIYRKALRLSGAERQKFNPGHITNIISTDLIRTELFIQMFHLQWTFPITLVVIISLLIHTIGVSALAGIAVLVCMIPLQVVAIKILVHLRRTNAKTTDERIRLTSESLSSIRVIKFFALVWEDSFLQRIFAIRHKELKAVVSGNTVRAVLTASGFAIPVLASVFTFIVYYVISPEFNPTVIFTALSLFNLLRGPLTFVPQMIGSWADARVALARIQSILMSAESEFSPTIDVAAKNGIVVKNGDFVWDTATAPMERGDPFLPADSPIGMESAKGDGVRLAQPASVPATLREINFEIPAGKLVAIVGAVGSGKSSLLSALVGQLKPVNPDAKVVFSGSVGLAAQVPWIMNASLKDNILFGLPFDKTRYDRAIEVCALKRDLEVLAGGELSEIGERGINLSGGQKQRVSLARLVYFESSIVLLDDVLSAVDSHVGKYIFNECICKALQGKTRLLVTHQLHFVPQCDIVIVMKAGKISEYGSYAELMAANGEFASLMQSYGGVPTNSPEEDTAELPKETEDKSSSGIESIRQKEQIVQNDVGGKALVTAEDRETGKVKTPVLVSFAVAMGGTKVVVLLVVLLILSQSLRIATDLYLVSWSDNELNGLSHEGYIWPYLALGICQSTVIIIFSIVVAVGGTVAAKSLHQDALSRVMHSPSQFFDTNPLGRVLNRCSRDQDVIDNTLPDAFRMFFLSFGTVVSTFALVSYSTHGWFLLALVPLLVVYYYIQAIYRSTARELKRLDALTRSPLYSHINESMTGVNTIKAYREDARFIRKTDALIDQNNVPYYLQQMGARWLGMRLEYIGNFLVAVTSIFGVSSRSAVSPGLMGLALSYVLQTTQLLQQSIRQYTDAEVQLVSIERMHFYATKVVVEAAGVIESSRPPADWPNAGIVELRDVKLRYQPDLPLVLKGISLVTRRHEKIGVVGRTGSGKSSLMLALFRMVEPESGEIVIDGIPTTSIGVKDLRSNLSIIPQDPVLFSGTVRLNLDPFGKHTDHELWLALESSGLKESVQDMEAGLDSPIDSGGENMSVGQRQLLCLARAILRKSAVVVLDECTANVDLKTDHQIQQTLRTKMQHATIFTIAHRLSTVIDADRILVLSDGAVAEFDSPAALLEKDGKDGRPMSIFASMVQET